MTSISIPYPTDPAINILWRIACRERALEDIHFRDVLYQACMEDSCFFFAFALWVNEPRAKIKRRPMIPWVHQVPIIHAMDDTIDEALEYERPVSFTLKKSRAQGGTYLYLGVTIRRELKERGFTTGLVTRNESLIDSRVDDSAVMYKLAWMLDRLPVWMLDGYDRTLSDHVVKLENDSCWSGYAATGDVARGGRTTVFCFDEPGSEEFISGNKDYKILSSVSSVSYCIFLISTFGVDSGVFYESATDPDNPRVYVLDWKDNPEHSKLSYITTGGVTKALKPEEQGEVDEYIASHQRELRSITRRGHQMEKKVRSPWYDAMCLQPGATPRYVARELDMDPRGAVGKAFPSDLLDRMKREHCKPPVWQGTPVFDSETLELKGLITRKDGPLKMWFRPGPGNSTPLGPFTVGCDMASGSDGAYSSNSVASGIDDRTGEQVMEYTIKGMPLIKFARVTVGLCMWLKNAFLAWEDSGMAGPFAKEILEVIYYGNVYWRDVPAIGNKKKSRKPGWPNRKNEDKAELFEKMALAMETGAYIPRSEELVRECGEYEWDKGKIIHAPTKNHGAQEVNHGDRCLIGSTGVLTEWGEIAIEHIVPGDLVWTRDGLRPVETCGITGFEPVFQVTLSNGRTLTGTGNHPVWTENRSWVDLQLLSPQDILLTWGNPNKEKIPCQRNQFEVESTSAAHQPRQSFSMGGSTTATRKPSKSTAEDTSGEGANPATEKRLHFTSPYGNFTTGLFQKALSCITRIVTSLITISRISRVLPILSMERYTKTEDISKIRGTLRNTPTSASNAEKSTRASVSTEQSSVPKRVTAGTGGNTDSKTRYERASSVDQSLVPKSAEQPRLAVQSAEAVSILKITKLEKPMDVYNLSVSGTPEYFAEGVLVHNCIASGVNYLAYESMNENSGIDKGGGNEDTVPEWGSILWCENLDRERKSKAGSPRYRLKDILR